MPSIARELGIVVDLHVGLLARCQSQSHLAVCFPPKRSAIISSEDKSKKFLFALMRSSSSLGGALIRVCWKQVRFDFRQPQRWDVLSGWSLREIELSLEEVKMKFMPAWNSRSRALQ